MRLNDKKRRKIRVSDPVFFHSLDNEYDVLRCKVTSIERYDDFFELYEHYPPVTLGYREYEVADPEDMYAIYERKDIERYGDLAIGIEVIDDLYLCDGHMHLEYGPLDEGYAMKFIKEGIRVS